MTLAEPPAAVFLGFASVAGVAAFARWFGLIIEDSWLAPLMLAMGIEFVAAALLASNIGLLNGSYVTGAITKKCLEVLAVAMGFTLQRMNDGDPTAQPWGHITMGAVIVYEVFRFGNICRHFGLPTGPFEAWFVWFEQMFGGVVRAADMRDAKVEAAVTERHAARNELWDSGEIKSAPAIDTITGEFPELIDSDVVPNEVSIKSDDDPGL